MLPRRPGHWHHALDETVRSLGFKLEAVVEADSLSVQKELVIHTPGLYSVLGPYSLKGELERGQLQVSRLVKPDLVRHVTLGFPRQGKPSPASHVVAETVQQLVKS